MKYHHDLVAENGKMTNGITTTKNVDLEHDLCEGCLCVRVCTCVAVSRTDLVSCVSEFYTVVKI